MVRALGRTQETLTFMTRHRSKDGRIFPVDVTSNFIEFEGKEYLCSFVHDISERIEAEKKILESEKRFRDIFRAVNDGILVIDPVEDLKTLYFLNKQGKVRRESMAYRELNVMAFIGTYMR